MKVSVIVPVYNVEKYLEKCLNSLIKQTFDKYEIIVVNDGSPDNSQKIIDKYEKKYPKLIKAYKKENGGLSSARNYGLKKAIGEYVAFVDSDDYVDINFLKKTYNRAIKDNADIVVFDVCAYNDKIKKYEPGLEFYSKNIKKNYLLSQPTAWNKLYKRTLFQKEIEFPVGLYYEDLGTSPKMIKYSNKIAYIKEPLYYYLIREGSIMHQKFNHKLSDIFTVLNNIYVFYKENNLLKEYNEEIEFLYIHQLIHIFGLKFLEDKEGYKYIKRIKKEIKNKFPKWYKNKYFKNFSFSKKIMCYLIYNNQITLISLLRRKKGI